MNLANKTFRNIQTGEDVNIIDSLGDIAISKNGSKIKVTTLLDSDIYIEKIDPTSFLSSHHVQLQNLADKIVQESEKNEYSVNNTNNNNNNNNYRNDDSAITITSIEDEKEELARKYGINNNFESDVNRQNEAFENILNPTKKEYIKPSTKEFQNNIVQDPIYHIFKNTKRNLEFKVDFSIDEKIPRLDFIEMMEDSYESSIIDFLATEFTNKILQNPSIIEEKIKIKIKSMVFNDYDASYNKDTEELNKDTTKVEEELNKDTTKVEEELNKDTTKVIQKRGRKPKIKKTQEND